MTPDAGVTRRHASALLWGLVGALAFLVFHQGYLLADGEFVGVGPVAVVTVAVFGVTAVASYYAEGYVAEGRPSPDGSGEGEHATGDADGPGPAAAAPGDDAPAGEPSQTDPEGWAWSGADAEAEQRPQDGSE